jgi:origin recognition complex subunit 4
MRPRNSTSVGTPTVVKSSGRASMSGRKRGKEEMEAELKTIGDGEEGRASKRAKVDTPKKKTVVPAEASAATASKRAAELMVEVQMQLNAQSFSPEVRKEGEVTVNEEGGRASKKAKADTPKTKAVVSDEASKAGEVTVETQADGGSPAPSPTKRGRPPSARKTATSVDVPKTATPPRTSKRTTAKAKPVFPKTSTAKDTPVEAKTPSKRKAKASAPPIRHSSNPLDDAPLPLTEAEPTPQTKTKEPDVLKELEEPEPRASASFDLQSRDAFLRNERWQRDKEARNFNFEGDVNEGRKLRSGKAMASVGTSEIGDEDDDDMVVEEDDADESGYEEDGKRPQGDALGEDAVFEADNDYLSQLTYDANVPVETLKTTLANPTKVHGSRVDEPKRHALTPFAQKVLRTVIGNLAGCETYSSSTPMGPEEEMDESLKHLVNLLTGTVERGEGNSCLVLGAKGSGKTRVSYLNVLSFEAYSCHGTDGKESHLHRPIRRTIAQ